MMKNGISLFSCVAILAILLQYRIATIPKDRPLVVTTWDAFGYYVYLPSFFIYKDYTHLDWLDSLDRKYHLTGGDGWQAMKLDNGNYTFKYLGGIALMQTPLFFAGHLIAGAAGFHQDGFSPPYQYAIAFGALLYCFLALLLLRWLMLRYWSDHIVAITLMLVALATNFAQYAAADNGQSHVYIFLLYSLLLFTTCKWHEQPRGTWAAATGYIIGLATMCRPTEAIMLFIPLLWNTHNKRSAKVKWELVSRNREHVLLAAIFGFLGILPQLFYWKITTGSFLYDVGSKWVFLDPHFRVLFGWEKGWFIYTPVTILMVAGLFLVKNYPFRNAVIWFCILNIWIIIAWDDWRYGGSYSTRALVQSYPVFALSLGAFVHWMVQQKWRYFFYALGIYLSCVNIFQLYQYNKTIIHYNDMNRKYYGRVYLNPHPTAEDMSLLDTDEFISDESAFQKDLLTQVQQMTVQFQGGNRFLLFEKEITFSGGSWIKLEATVNAPGKLWKTYLNLELEGKDTVKQSHVRLFSPLSEDDRSNSYAFFMKVPAGINNGVCRIFLTSGYDFSGTVDEIKLFLLEGK